MARLERDIFSRKARRRVRCICLPVALCFLVRPGLGCRLHECSRAWYRHRPNLHYICHQAHTARRTSKINMFCMFFGRTLYTLHHAYVTKLSRKVKSQGLDCTISLGFPGSVASLRNLAEREHEHSLKSRPPLPSLLSDSSAEVNNSDELEGLVIRGSLSLHPGMNWHDLA